ncbi:MAG: ROK family transcriptional regulator [Planctomycetia bacterium]|nr:ROK family transcriptional regulator [Planctomycetia bacterium]
MKRTQSRAQPSLLRELNTRQVLSAIQACGPLSRAEITRQTGISGPTVTRTVSALLEANLLEEGDLRQSPLGRPGRVLSLASKKVAVLGIVVEPQRCELVSAGLDGQIHADSVRSFATPSTYADFIKAFAKQVKAASHERQTNVLGLGVTVPGLLNRWDKRILVSPNVHQIDGRPLEADLQKELGLDTLIVQESHALCLAEQLYGAAQAVSDFAMLDISSGLGLGVITGGRNLLGHSGLAGELGHITVELNGRPCGCGNRGCLETVASDTALATMISERIGRTLSMDEIVAAVQAGELQADAEFGRMLEYLAVGIAVVINVFNPQKLFIYGRAFDADPRLFDRLLELTRRRTLPPSLADCEIIRARGSKKQGAVAAIIQQLTGMSEP